MKFLSPWSGRGRRPSPGFTLLEIVIATGLGVVVLGLVAQAYFAANKARALTVGGSMLKVAGSHAISEMYKNLHQSRHLFGRGYTADTFLQRLPILPYYDGPGKLSPGIEPDELRLADIRLKGSFWIQDEAGTANPDFDPEAAGNTLFFATTEPKATVQEPPGEDMQRDVFGSHTIQFAAMRLHLYLLTHRALPRGQRVRVPDPWVYQLMHFRSKPYLDAREVVDWMRQIKSTGGTGADAFIDGRLAALATEYPGALALDANDARNAIFEVAAAPDHLGLAPDTDDPIEEGHYRTPLSGVQNQDFGIPMVAFNTTGASPDPTQPGARPGVPVARLDVPAYARDDARHPYGLEVMIGGPPDRRQVLVRLSLAARTTPGNVMVGETFQQVVQVADF